MQEQVDSLNDPLLEKYAQASHDIVLANQSDLDPKDRAMPEMLAWCREQGGIVVLQSGYILSCSPGDRKVQNCKVVMLNKQLTPQRVRAATKALINWLLVNAEMPMAEKVLVPAASAQQQRLRTLVREAIEADATDIHLSVRKQITRIHFRRHGELHLHAEWLPHLGREVAAVAFNRETDHADTHFNPLVPQSAAMPLQLESGEVRLRLASLPAQGGFDMVMRLLTTGSEKIQTLHVLGYQAAQVRLIAQAVQLSAGAVLVSGPTGSGKTTTLAACMQMVDPARKVYTIEDPVERLISTATQVPIHTDQFDRSFASMGRAVLRMDPDVMVIGEVRDLETAEVMARSALTGHLVFSTLHTHSALAIVRRLLDLGLSCSLLCDPDFLSCLVCQRLLPKVCQECCIPLNECQTVDSRSVQHWRRLHAGCEERMRVRNPRGCQACKQTGVSHRTVVAEVVWMDDAARAFIGRGDFTGWEAHLREQGWFSYQEQACRLVRTGLVDPADADKVLGRMQDVQYHAQMQPIYEV